jgi:hypothetical protein
MVLAVATEERRTRKWEKLTPRLPSPADRVETRGLLGQCELAKEERDMDLRLMDTERWRASVRRTTGNRRAMLGVVAQGLDTQGAAGPMMIQSSSRSSLPTSTGIATVSTMNFDILVGNTRVWHDGLARCSERIITGFRDRRLVEAVLGIEMLVVEDRVSRLRTLMLA